MTDFINSELSADDKNAWSTDPAVFYALDKEFRFALDAAASKNNYKVANYLTEEDNALTVDWLERIETSLNTPYVDTLTVWVNPPYGRGCIKQFMDKAIEQKAKGVTTVMLVPATLEASWLPLNEVSEIRIVTGGRLSFVHPIRGNKIAGNTKGSMFVIFSPLSSPLVTRYIDREELLSIGREYLQEDAA